MEATRSARGGYQAAVVATLLVVTGAFAACAEDGPAGDASAVRGEQVYEQSCASCHGADLRGTPTGPSLLSIVYEPSHHSDEAFRVAIQQGSPQHHWNFGPMPAVGGVRGTDIDAVIAFVREQQELHGFDE